MCVAREPSTPIAHRCRARDSSCIAIAVVLPSCSGSTDNTYYAVRALVSTGANGTDGNVQLCFTVNGASQCHNLSSDDDDFEAKSQETFDVYLQPRVAHGTPFSGPAVRWPHRWIDTAPHVRISSSARM